MWTSIYEAALLVLAVATICKNIEARNKATKLPYSYRFTQIDDLSPKEFSAGKNELGVNKVELITRIQKNYKSSKLQNHLPLKLQNLYSILEGFQNDHCILLVDNWQGIDIKQTSAMPTMLRKLQLVFSHRKLLHRDRILEYLDPVFVPAKNSFMNESFFTQNLKGDIYHICPSSRLYFGLISNNKNDDFCAELIHEMFLLNSRPWQCEIQVSLLMSDQLRKLQNFPGIFRYNYDFKFQFSPSSRPKIYMFLDSKNVKKVDSASLLSWTSNSRMYVSERKDRTELKNGYVSQNNINIFGQFICILNERTCITGESCYVKALSLINLCIDCPTLMSSVFLAPIMLSFAHLASSAAQANNLWHGSFYSSDTGSSDGEQFNLGRLIPAFQNYDQKSIAMPLKHLQNINKKYSDKIQILAFAFTSVVKHMLGNITNDLGHFDNILNKECRCHILRRYVAVSESLNDDRNVALDFENKFGSLRFVSCGSRGLKYLKIERFLSVFDQSVWKWILSTAVILSLAMNLIRGSISPFHSINKIFCLVKVLLEQGDPFPERFTKSKPLRFVISGTLLAGLVLSNAFKSTNVYNIVLPKQPLSFRNIDELLEFDYKIYSKTKVADYFVQDYEYIPQSLEVLTYGSIFKYFYVVSKDLSPLFSGLSEIENYYQMIFYKDKKIFREELNLTSYLSNITQQHPGLLDIIVQPLNILRPLAQIHLIDLRKIHSLAGSSDFWKHQDMFIARSLKQCNKTAWILPDYQAQQISRMLYRSGLHTDVGIKLYFRPKLNFDFRGAMPSHLIQKSSLIRSTGLLEWWSNLINRTDLVRFREAEPPVKPKMSGNIQIVFLILPSGISIAFILMLLELHGRIYKMLKTIFGLCVLALTVVQKYSLNCYRKIQEVIERR